MVNLFPHADFPYRRLNASFFKHGMELGRQAASRLVNAGLAFAGLHTKRYNRSDLAAVRVIHASYATGGGTGGKVSVALNLPFNYGLSVGGL